MRAARIGGTRARVCIRCTHSHPRSFRTHKKKNTPPNPLQPISYTSKAFVEATHWQSAPFKAFMATLNAQATWESKSITTYTEADAGF